MSDRIIAESRVLMTRTNENELLLRWCERVANEGGQFSIDHNYVGGNWYTTYTIAWPTDAETA